MHPFLVVVEQKVHRDIKSRGNLVIRHVGKQDGEQEGENRALPPGNEDSRSIMTQVCSPTSPGTRGRPNDEKTNKLCAVTTNKNAAPTVQSVMCLIDSVGYPTTGWNGSQITCTW